FFPVNAKWRSTRFFCSTNIFSFNRFCHNLLRNQNKIKPSDGGPLGSTRFHQKAGENPLKESFEIYRDVKYLSSCLCSAQIIICLSGKQFFLSYQIEGKDILL